MPSIVSALSFIRSYWRNLLVIALVALGAFVFAHSFDSDTEPQVRAVRTAVAMHADVARAASLTGTLEAVREVDIASKSGGLVSALYGDVGTRVTVGRALAQLDASQARATVASLSQSIEAAQQTLAATDALYATRIRSAENGGDAQTPGLSALTDAAIVAQQIDTSLGTLFSMRDGSPVSNTSAIPESDLSARDGQAKILAREKIAAYQHLNAEFQQDFHADILGHDPSTDAVNRSIEEASSLLSAAKTALSASYTALSATVSSASVGESHIESAKQQVATLGTQAQSLLSALHDSTSDVDALKKERDAQLAGVRGQLAQLVGEKQVSETLLADGTIAAPFGGIITQRFVERGAVVGAGTPLLHLVDDSELKLVVGVPDTEARTYRMGDSATIHADGISASARISKINPAVDPASRKVAVELTVPNSSRALAPGSYARAVFAQSHTAQVAVPRSAVFTQYGTSYAFVVTDGVARRRVVKAGAQSDDLIEITSGVASGEVVVTSGVSYLRDGDAVAITN